MGFFKRFKQPKAELSLGVDKNQLFFGDEIKGIVNLKSQEDFDVEEITVSFNCVETVTKTRAYQEIVTKPATFRERQAGIKPRPEKVWTQEEYDDDATLYSDHLQLSGSMPVIIGLNLDFPFVFKLPSIGRETYHSVDNNVVWSISAFMKIRDRKAIYSRGGNEILVAKPIVSATPTKEVVREVVLIPCAYCSGLMPQTSVFCPNCGARRKN